MTRPLLAILALAANVPAQAPPPAVHGPYHFVQLMVREEAQGRLTVRSGGGTITFDGKGVYRLKARFGTNKEAAQPIERDSKYTVGGPERVVIANPLDPATLLPVAIGEGGAILIGGSHAGPGTYDLFVAAPAGDATPALAGKWAGGYMAVADGATRGLITSFLDLSLDGGGKIPTMMAIGHTAWIDDVNRKEESTDLAYTMAATGVGRTEITGFDDTILPGEKTLLASRDGQLLFGFGVGAGRRDILVLVKKPADQGTLLLRGRYWISELTAEGPYKFQPEAIRFSSAAGILQAAGDGRARIQERVKRGGRTISLTTLNMYRIGSDGSSALGARIDQQTRNFAAGEDGRIFAGAQVDDEGRLTLEHGIVVGARGYNLHAYQPPAGIWWGAPMHADYSLVSAASPAKPGETLIVMAVDTGPKVKVAFGGKTGEVKSAVCLAGALDVCQIHVRVPAEVVPGTQVPVVIESEAALVDLFDIAIARQ